MKRSLLFILSSALLLSNKTYAQIPVVDKVLPKVTVGIKAGANFQELTGNTDLNDAYKAGILGGAFVGLTKKKIGVQVEAMVKSATFDTKASVSNPSVSLKTAYLDVPVLFEYKLVSRLWLQIGPQFSYLITAKEGNTDYKSSFNTSEFSGVAGLNVNLPLHFTVGARYILGLTDINKESVTGVSEAWKNRSIQVYVGFRFI